MWHARAFCSTLFDSWTSYAHRKKRGVFIVTKCDLNLSEKELDQKNWAQTLEKWYVISAQVRLHGPEAAIWIKPWPIMIRKASDKSSGTEMQTPYPRGKDMIKFLKWYVRDNCLVPKANKMVEDI